VLGPQDLQVIRYNGGGGYGDPLDRDYEAVHRDVREGAVSSGAARGIYGIVIDGSDRVDVPSTRTLRRALRAGRIGKDEKAVPVERRDVEPTGIPISEYLQMAPTGAAQCTWCGDELSGSGAGWKDHAAVRRSPIARVYGNHVDDDSLTLREFCCPACGTLLDCEVARPDDPPLHDEIIIGGTVVGNLNDHR
jgi:N-methylhydantoinase B